MASSTGEAVDPPAKPGSGDVVVLGAELADDVVGEEDDSAVLEPVNELNVVLVTKVVVVDVSSTDTSEGNTVGPPACEVFEVCPGPAAAVAVVPSISGQSCSMAVFLKNMPIRVLGKAVMPLHLSLRRIVIASKEATHCGEQAVPS